MTLGIILALGLLISVVIVALEVAPMFRGDSGDDLGWSTVGAIAVAVAFAVGLWWWIG